MLEGASIQHLQEKRTTTHVIFTWWECTEADNVRAPFCELLSYFIIGKCQGGNILLGWMQQLTYCRVHCAGFSWGSAKIAAAYGFTLAKWNTKSLKGRLRERGQVVRSKPTKNEEETEDVLGLATAEWLIDSSEVKSEFVLLQEKGYVRKNIQFCTLYIPFCSIIIICEIVQGIFENLNIGGSEQTCMHAAPSVVCKVVTESA